MHPKLFLLHIQKTAGRAVAGYLAEQYPVGPEGFPVSEPPTELTDEAKRLLASYPSGTQRWIKSLCSRQLIADGVHVDATVWRVLRHDYLGVTVLREPRERVLSLFNMWNSWPDKLIRRFNPIEKEAYTFAKSHSLAQTLRSDHRIIRLMMHDTQTRQLASSLQDLSDAARDTDAAIETLESFEVVGITEMINSTMRLICNRFGWEPQSDIATIGQGSGRVRFDSLDEETRDELDRVTRLDQIVYRHALNRLDRDLITLQNDSFTPRAFGGSEDGRVTLTMSDPVPGQGWHIREGPPEAPLRWTGPGTESNVWLSLPSGTSHTLSLRLAGFMGKDILEGLRILAGEIECPWSSRKRGQETIVESTIPPVRAGLDGPTKITLRVPRTMSHKELDPSCTDLRRKGLNVRAIEVTPIGVRPKAGV